MNALKALTPLLVFTVAACGAGKAYAPASTMAMPMAAESTSSDDLASTPSSDLADVNTDNALNTDGRVSAIATPFLRTSSDFRRQVYALGGKVFAEHVSYLRPEDRDETDASAVFRIKLQPNMLPDLLDWLGSHTTIVSQNVNSIMAMESEGDAAIVRTDVVARVAEIDASLANPDLSDVMRAALTAERDSLVPATIANPQAQADNTRRVAVLDVTLSPPRKTDPMMGGDMIAHARGSVIGLGVLGGPSGGTDTRVGGGVGVGGSGPVAALEVVGYSSGAMNTSAGVIATLGIGTYARALGGGKRSSFNPYVGGRVGYAYLERNYFAVEAEVGVELVKKRGMLLTVSARPIGLVGHNSQAAVEGGATLGLAF